MLARVISAILGTLVFIVHFGVLIWFNTEPVTISAAGKAVVYRANCIKYSDDYTNLTFSAAEKRK